jgi:hypothetical protein
MNFIQYIEKNQRQIPKNIYFIFLYLTRYFDSYISFKKN